MAGSKDEAETANNGDPDEDRRELEREMWFRIIRDREEEREAAEVVVPGLKGLFDALKKPDDPDTILEPYPKRGQDPVLREVVRSPTAPGRWIGRGDNFAPDTRVLVSYDDAVVECPAVLIGPGELEFEPPADTPAGATVQVLSAAEVE